jgi:hypothetical protein
MRVQDMRMEFGQISPEKAAAKEMAGAAGVPRKTRLQAGRLAAFPGLEKQKPLCEFNPPSKDNVMSLRSRFFLVMVNSKLRQFRTQRILCQGRQGSTSAKFNRP